jgi:hypothetical protein
MSTVVNEAGLVVAAAVTAVMRGRRDPVALAGVPTVPCATVMVPR